MRLSDVTNAALRALMGNENFVKGPLAINAGGALTVKSTVAYTYSVDGVIYSKAILAAQSIVPTHQQIVPGSVPNPVSAGYVCPINTTMYLTVGLDAAGAFKCVQGGYDGQMPTLDPSVGIGTLGAMGTSVRGASVVPDMPDGVTAIGVIKVVTGGAATFQPGVDALDKAGVAFTFFDVMLLPSNTRL